MQRATILLLFGMLAAAEFDLPPVPRIEAGVLAHPRHAIHAADEAVRIGWRVAGRRTAPDTLRWVLRDLDGRTRAEGSAPVPAGSDGVAGEIAPGAHGAGAFALHLRLERSGATLERSGTRPAGFVAYGVLPALAPPPLAAADASRFGAQGTNFIASGRWMEGDPLAPLYPLLGARWVYLNRKLPVLAPRAEADYAPLTDAAELRRRGSYEAGAGLALLVDLHGVPDWMAPGGTRPGGDPTTAGQRPPADWDAFARLVGAAAREQAARRRALFPHQAADWYQLHWEPDWHWRGDDEGFIRMYAVARAAIRANDPDGRLLGPNYGVLATGNRHLDRLLPAGLADHLDGLLTHTYHIPLDVPPEQGGLVRDVRHLVALARRHLPAGARLMNTEWGVSYGGRPPEVDPGALRREAAWFLRGHLIALGEGIDTTFFFYTADHGQAGHGLGLCYNLTCPDPAFGATHVAPKPVFIGAAAMTRLLEGTASLGALDYLGDGVLGYAFARGDERLAVLWSVDGVARSVPLACAAEAVTAYDAMGNPQRLACVDGMAAVPCSDLPTYVRGLAPSALAAGLPAAELLPGAALAPPAGADAAVLRRGAARRTASDGHRLPEDLDPGTWLVQWLAGGRLLASQAVAVLAPVAGTPVRPARGQRGALELASRIDAPQDCLVELLDDGVVAAGRTATLPARASLLVAFPAEAGAGRRPLRARLTVAGRRLGEWPLPEAALVVTARRAAAPPRIDGDLADWQLESFASAGGVEPLAGALGRWQGDADLSLRYAVQVGPGHLYLAVRVRDQEHRQGRTPAEAWREDSLQVGLGLAQAGGAARQKLLAALTSAGELQAWRHEGAGLAPGDARALMAVAVQRRGDETCYEWAIPWSQVAPGLAGPPEPGQLLLGLLVNDVDSLADGRAGERLTSDPLGGMAWSDPERFAAVRW